MKPRTYSIIFSLFVSLFAVVVAAQTNGPNGVGKVIFFDYDSFVVLPEFENVIKVHAEFLIANPKSKVSIEGHTEDRGGYEYNLSLAQRRAKAVTSFLLKFGVPSIQIESVGFGSVKPADEGDDQAAFAKNRRVEFVYR